MTKLKRRVQRPNPAAVLAIIALVAALGGGAYAAKKAKKIGTKRIKDAAVTTRKLAPVERSEGFVTRQASNLALPASVDTTVATLNLQTGGSYQLIATVALGGNSASINPIRCQLRDSGFSLAAGDGYSDQATFSDTVTLTAFSDGGTITLTCDPTAASTARDRTIAATRVAQVTSQ